jgi:hypothetical protein
MSAEAEVAGNLDAVRRRVEGACRRAGRSSDEVALVCVTKMVEPRLIRAAYEAGARVFGENYGQDLRDKARALSDLPDVRWHFIGGLQRNKVKYAVGRAHLIHSVDSPELVEEIDRRAAAMGITQEVLVQLNLAEEETKSGVSGAEVGRLLSSFAGHPHCRCTGLMALPPFFDEPLRARPFFARLREIREEQARIARPGVMLQHLSMGMSGDYEVAVEEGATLVRVGTAIFGARAAPAANGD